MAVVSETLAEAIADTVSVPLLALSDSLTVEFANPAFYREFLVSPSDTIGQRLETLGNGQWNIPELQRLLNEVLPARSRVEDYRVEHTFEQIGRRIMLVNARRIDRRNGTPPSVLISFTDITERERLAFEAEAEAEFNSKLIDSVREALIVLEHDLRVKAVNQAFYEMFLTTAQPTVGRMVYDLGNGQWNIPALRRLLEDILPRQQAFDDYEVEHEFETIGRRIMLLNARRLDHLNYVLLAIRDVTAQRDLENRRAQTERRQRLLIDLHDRVRPLRDPTDVQAAAAAAVGLYLPADQVAYASIDAGQEYASIERDWNSGAIATNAGCHRLEDFGPAFIDDLKAGRTVVIPDVALDPRTAAASAHFASRGIGAFLNVPLVKSGRLVAVLAIHKAQAHGWSPADVELAEEVAERTWAAVERAQSEQALARITALLDAIFDAAPIGLAFLDRELRFQKVNAFLAEINGLTPAAHIGKRPDELLTQLDDIGGLMDKLAAVRDTGESSLGVEIHGATRAPGADRYCGRTSSPYASRARRRASPQRSRRLPRPSSASGRSSF